MAVLLLIRHGRTPANVDGVLAGRQPGVALDEVGVASAVALGQRLSGIQVSRVVASPLERTVQTARLVFPELTPVLDDRLIECDYGSWQGRALADLATEPLWNDVQSAPDEVVFPAGESMADMFSRAADCVREWDDQVTAEFGPAAVWAAISHGDVIKAIVADAMGLPLKRFQSLAVDPASVSVIRRTQDRSTVVKWNEAGDSWVTGLGAGMSAEHAQPGGQSGKDQG